MQVIAPTSQMAKSVFVDTNIFKFSAVELPRYQSRQECIAWGPTTHSIVVYDEVCINPNLEISNIELRHEVELLPRIANLGNDGTLKFVQSLEGRIEMSGLPNLDSRSGRFFGAQVQMLKDIPFRYDRILFGAGVDAEVAQMSFLESIENPRFDELKKACGAYQGKSHPPNRNQLLDAFHVWCAERSGCEFFLTLDFKLQRVLSKSKALPQVRITRPSELLQLIDLKSPDISRGIR